MRRTLFSLVALWVVASVANAQTAPYAPQAYPQPGAPANYPPYGYPQNYQPPIQRVQYPSGNYGNYPSSPPQATYQATPGYYAYNNGYGVNYIYAYNPYANTAAPASRTPSRPTSWPAPPPRTVQAGDEGDAAESRAPQVPFQRPTNEFFWFNANYIAGLITPMRLATPLVTTGSQFDTAPGAFGQPSTQVLYGDNNVNFGLFSGMRMEGGLFLDQCNRFSLDMSGFLLFANSQSYSITSDANGNPVITRPVSSLILQRPAAFIDALPGLVAGSFSATSRSEMSGIEFNVRYHAYFKEHFHVDGLLGFRYLRLAEQLQIQDQFRPLQPPGPGFQLSFQGNPVDVTQSLTDQDTFRTANHFFGPQIGARLAWESKWVDLTTFAKFALGATVEQSTINGSTTLVSPTGNQTANGGILALPSNIGSHSRAVVGIVPELGLNVGINVTQCVRLNLGYSLLLWNHVVRPGSQLDSNVNGAQAPSSQNFGNVIGPVGPIARFNEEFFWAHTFNIGLEIHY